MRASLGLDHSILAPPQNGGGWAHSSQTPSKHQYSSANKNDVHTHMVPSDVTSQTAEPMLSKGDKHAFQKNMIMCVQIAAQQPQDEQF